MTDTSASTPPLTVSPSAVLRSASQIFKRAPGAVAIVTLLFSWLPAAALSLLRYSDRSGSLGPLLILAPLLSDVLFAFVLTKVCLSILDDQPLTFARVVADGPRSILLIAAFTLAQNWWQILRAGLLWWSGAGSASPPNLAELILLVAILTTKVGIAAYLGWFVPVASDTAGGLRGVTVRTWELMRGSRILTGAAYVMLGAAAMVSAYLVAGLFFQPMFCLGLGECNIPFSWTSFSEDALQALITSAVGAVWLVFVAASFRARSVSLSEHAIALAFE